MSTETIEMDKVVKSGERILTCGVHPGVSVVFSTRIHAECPLCRIERSLEELNSRLNKAINE